MRLLFSVDGYISFLWEEYSFFECAGKAFPIEVGIAVGSASGKNKPPSQVELRGESNLVSS